jgi:5'-nucleotidase
VPNIISFYAHLIKILHKENLLSTTHFLVSNDDGIFAPGLETLVKALLTLGRVTIAAPNRERSAASHSLTLEHPIRAKKVPYPLPVQNAYAVSGTPSDCVKLALSHLLPEPPTFVISGMNSGANMCVDVFYSGTVAAACEGIFLGLPAVAFSLASRDPDADFNAACPWIEASMREILRCPPPPGTMFNVNIPGLETSQIKGWRVTRLGKVRYNDTYELRHDPGGKPYYWLKGSLEVLDADPETDIITVREGFVSITPLRPEMTDFSGIPRLNRDFQPTMPVF